MLSERDVRELLAVKSESKSLDYKQSMNWGTATAEQKAAVAKDVLAMANTQDGGKIVIGVRDSDFEPVGMPEEEFQSFDTTGLVDFLNRYADPSFACGVYKFTIDGKKFVAIEVPEFSVVPIICKTDAGDSQGRAVLKRGAIYIRTNRAASEVVPDAAAMRELMNRAVTKRGDEPVSAPGHQPYNERYGEGRELIDEIHESIRQMGYAFIPLVPVKSGDERNDYQAGIRRGNRVLGNRILIADAVQKAGLKNDWDELVQYTHSGRGPIDRWQQASPTMGGFDKKARDFQEKLMKAAREDMSTKEKEQAEFENFPIDVSLQQGSPGNYIVNVRNNSEREVTVETIQILRGDDVGECPLTEAAKAKPNDDWKVGPRSGKQLYWGPLDDPVVMLRTLDPKKFPPMRGVVVPITWLVTFRVEGRLLTKRRTQKVNVSGNSLSSWGAE